ncbi:MAG: UDP-N-acetylmuramate dehydrogenase [Bacteroidales bacterium]|nr:UDP-N-acetylmuramate dehydrogenase [Bacteroidales bacterium]
MTDSDLILQHDVPLKHLNTMNLEAYADNFCVVKTQEDLFRVSQVYKQMVQSGKRPHVFTLGEGSNTVFAAKNITSFIIKMEYKGITTVKETAKHVFVQCNAGEIFRDVVIKFCQSNLSGLENLSAIYGTVGAAPVQNIGAYGQEVKNCIESVRVFDISTGSFEDYTNSQCQFGYRNSVFKYQNGEKIIVSVVFRLNKEFKPILTYANLANRVQSCGTQSFTPLFISDTVTKIRNEKLPDPEIMPNCGSFFKNPVVSMEEYGRLLHSYGDIPSYEYKDGVKISAGWLIEKCGLKGVKVNGVGFHDKQALVLVNYNSNDAGILLDFVKQTVQTVSQKFGIELVMEPHIVR